MNVEALIPDYAQTMAAKMLEIARRAQSEEDVRHAINGLIEGFLLKAGMDNVGWHEYALAGGRVDSKYGAVVIEYKHPHGAGKITEDLTAPGTQAVVKQLLQRFADFRKHESIEPERIFGVGCDGDTFVFVRYRGKQPDMDAQPVTPLSVERLLRALVSLGAKGLSFTPDHLATYFGAGSETARIGISAIYAVIADTENPKAITFFNQWKILFGEVCGYDVEGRSPKIEKLAEHYAVPKAKPAELLFSVHTYYAILMKFLAAEIVSSFSPVGLSVMRQCLAAPSSEALREKMQDLEQGGIWSQLGITNFLEGDIFSWYLAAWDERMDGVVRGIVRGLEKFDPTTLSVDPSESRDLLKKLYQNLFPKSVRHDLGEYYTPDWLAEHVLNELGYDGNPDKRLLDPACGSGTFLVMALNRVKQWFANNRHQCGFGEGELLQKVLRNIIGFDLNPLAVMAARTNYLMAVRDLLKFRGEGVELPVYLCDSVMTPAEYGPLFAGARADRRVIKTSAGEFHIPTDVARDRVYMGRYAEALESCVRNGFSADNFVLHCRSRGLELEDMPLHKRLYRQLLKLDGNNRNGIWARVIKNAFAPLFIGKVDYVAGNPPWVNWESLPPDYRDAMKPLWQYYGLFSLTGAAGRLGGGKKDLSMLFVYSGVHHYLKDGGQLGFVITQSVFKTQGAGDGFRQLRFYPAEGPVYIQPLKVDDLSALQVFEGATNRTAVLICEKSRDSVRYPVPYVQWDGMGRVPQEWSLAEVRKQTRELTMAAVPVRPGKDNSPWLTVPEGAAIGITKALGKSAYVAHAGCCTWLNGVFWVRPVATSLNGDIVVENLHDVGKIKVDQVYLAVEPALLHPLVRGRDVRKWRAESSAYILLTQDPSTRAGIPDAVMKANYPRTFGYLKRFEELLRGRSGYRKYYKPADPFWSLYDVGRHTTAKIKVLWRQMLPQLRMAVLVPGTDAYLGDKVPVTQHVVSQVEFPSEQEAHYFAALGNTSMATLINVAYSTGKSFGAPHLLEHVAIPRYQAAHATHTRLSDLSRQCHAAVAANDTAALLALEAEVDRAAAQLWGITEDELKAIQEALLEMSGGRSADEGADEDDNGE